MKYQSLCGLILFFSVSSAFSLDGIPSAPSPAKALELIEIPGQAAKLVFADGREATLMTSNNAVATASLPLQVTENLCNPEAAIPHCHYQASILSNTYNFVWSKNPDPQKLGHILQTQYSENSPATDWNGDSTFINNFSNFLPTGARAPLPPDRIICDRFDWLPDTDPTSSSLIMKLWSAEFMMPNAETDVNQNQAAITFSQVEWIKNKTDLELKNVKWMSTNLSIFPPITDTSMIIMENKNLEECQIGMASSISAAIKLINQQGKQLIKEDSGLMPLESFVPNLNRQVKSALLSPGYVK